MVSVKKLKLALADFSIANFFALSVGFLSKSHKLCDKQRKHQLELKQLSPSFLPLLVFAVDHSSNPLFLL